MHKHTRDDRGTNLVFRMMLAEQAMLAGSQHIILQHHVLLAVAVIEKITKCTLFTATIL